MYNPSQENVNFDCQYNFTEEHILLMKDEFEKEYNTPSTQRSNKCMFLNSFFNLNIQETQQYEKILVIDLGGTYLKLALMNSNCKFLHLQKKYKIVRNKHTKKIDLFDWIVKNIKDYLAEAGIDNQDEPIFASMSFSYPLQMESVGHGKIVAFTKEFPFKELDLNQDDGLDPVLVLNERLVKEKVNVIVKMLMNDTVATFLASYRKNKSCQIGIVLGTGTNAAFVNDQKEIINSEWGQFMFEDGGLKDFAVLNQNIDNVCGGLALKKELQDIFKKRDIESLINNYYKDGNNNPIIHKLKDEKLKVLSVLTVVLLGKSERYVIGINGSGLEEQKDQDMFKQNIINSYKFIYKSNVEVEFIFEEGASLIGLAYGLCMSGNEEKI